MRTRIWLGALATAVCLVAACGDDDDGGIVASPPDGGTPRNEGGTNDPPDSGTPDSTTPPPPVSTLATLALPNTYNPYGLQWGSDGKIYMSGSTLIGSNRELAVWRFTADGALDTTFNGTGVVTTDVPGTESSYDLVEVTPNNWVVQATVGNQTNGGAIYLAKLTTSGTPAFSDVTRIHFEWSDSDAGWPGPNAPSYVSWAIGLDKSIAAQPKIVVFAFGAPARSGGTQRTDLDRWVARVSASTFEKDPTFADAGVFTTNADDAGRDDSARYGEVYADGTILSAGYTDFGAGNNIVLIKLLANGNVDPAFGFGTLNGIPGQTRYNPWSGVAGFAEAYHAVRQSNGRIVTTGYGTTNTPATSLSLDVAMTGITPSGVDGTFGAAGGSTYQSEGDPEAGVGATPYRDRGRDLALLPDDRIVVAGVYDEFAAIYVFDKNGKPDPGSGKNGLLRYAHTGNFFKIKVSPDGKRIAASAESKNLTGDAAAPLDTSVLTVLKVGP